MMDYVALFLKYSWENQGIESTAHDRNSAGETKDQLL